jgi:hypothetical protein
MLIALAVLPCIFLFPYVFGPVLIYFTMKVSGRPTLKEFYLEDPKVPRDTWEFVEDVLEEIEQDGFAVLGAYFLGTLVPNVRSFVVLIGKQKTCEKGIIAVTYGEAGLARMREQHVEFSTSFADGGCVDTSNAEQLSAFLPVPGRVANQLSWIKDVRRLYRIHRAIAQRERPDAERTWKVGDDPAAYLEANLAEELARQVPNGCLRRDASGDYRATFRTAMRVAYQNLWPFSAIAKARRRSRGEKLLRELQVERVVVEDRIQPRTRNKPSNNTNVTDEPE